MERASLISSLVRGVAEGFFFRRPLPGRGSLEGKKWSSNALLIATGFEASGRDGEPGGFSRGDQLFGRPDVVWGGSCKKVSPVGGFSSLDGLEVAEFGLSCCVVGVSSLGFFGPSGDFCELFPEGG